MNSSERKKKLRIFMRDQMIGCYFVDSISKDMFRFFVHINFIGFVLRFDKSIISTVRGLCNKLGDLGITDKGNI